MAIMKDFIDKLNKEGLLLIKTKKGLTLKKKQGKLEAKDINYLKNHTNFIDFIQNNKEQLTTYLENNSSEQSASRLKVKDVAAMYKLSPLQEGMLFHSLYDTNSKAYKEQLIVDFSEGMNLELFQKTWDYLLNNHSILRTSIIHDRLSIPVQCVYHQVTMPISLVDYSKLSKEEQSHKINQFLEEDEEKPIDFNRAPLMRITLIKLGKEAYKMIWTFHHIILDGWSISVVMGAFLSTYEILAKGETPSVVKEDIYEDFIKYVNSRDKYSDKSFWKGYLRGFNTPTVLPFIESTVDKNKDKGILDAVVLEYDKEATKRIIAYTREKNITVSTLFQGVWAFLLSKYTNNQDVAFGVTVSGRPLSLDNVEKRVGLYINTIPLRAEINDEKYFSTWLEELQKEHVLAREHQYTELSKIQKWVETQGELFNTILVFENYPIQQTLSQENWSLKIKEVGSRIQSNSLFTITIGMSDHIKLNLKYNENQLGVAYVERIKGHFKTVLFQLIDKGVERIADLSILTDAEKLLLINNPIQATDYVKEKTVVDLFEKQSIKTPDKIAISFEGQILTYKILNERANQLARYLYKKGIGKKSFVATCFHNPLENVIAIWGILKLGATYVPIDAELPEERLDFILDDTKARAIISDKRLTVLQKKENSIEQILLPNEWDTIKKERFDKLNQSIAISDLAYVIYTSGSTGKPKGVMITHANLSDYIQGFFSTIDLEECQGFGLMSTLSADLGNTILYGALLSGGNLHLFSKDTLRDAIHLHEYFHKEQIDCIKLVPSHWKALQLGTNLLLPEQLIIFGGEELSAKIVKKIKSKNTALKIINHYGPTETTIGKLMFQINDDFDKATVPIGQSFSNSQVYVVNEKLDLCPIGVLGELLIGGAGVAAGYLNQIELTKERFITNPFSPNSQSKLYRTGDLVRKLSDGNIEFKGRIDDQIKINGYRIEPGEIQTILQESNLVNDCAVLVKKTAASMSLSAYVVSQNGFEKEKIQQYLKDKLPEYMVPSEIIELEEIPLTNNGKIDRSVLLSIESILANEKEHIAPRNKVEKDLAEIWKVLLKVEEIGVYDNFFELGGDSIVSIQLVSRAKRAGYRLKPKDIFQNQTIDLLAKAISKKTEKPLVEQSQLKGDCGLLPIQQRFFEMEYEGMSHFNQSVLLGVSKKLKKEHLEQVLVTVLNQHDALHFTYRKEENIWKQTYGARNTKIEYIDLAKSKDLSTSITETCQFFQENLNIEEGVLFRAVIIKTPDTESKDRLFVVIHHLAVDGVSWRILTDQIENSLDALAKGNPIKLDAKTSSYRTWVEGLSKYALTDKVEKQLTYWQSIAQDYNPLPIETTTTGIIRSIHKKSYSIDLEEHLTKSLLRDINKTYHTEIDDILLAALVQTIYQWSQERNINIGIEGHGRESILKRVDCSSTVGWFTNLYPVSFIIEKDWRMGDLIRATKERLRAVPEKGMGFGLLRYLHSSEEIRTSLVNAKWDILFNYLGQLDNVVNSSKWFDIAEESTGKGTSPNRPSLHKLEIVSAIKKGSLNVIFKFSDLQYNETTIEKLATSYIQVLTSMINHCLDTKQSNYTPTDLGLSKEMNIKELDELNESLKEKEVEGDEILKF